jgi:hypothetical protein
MSYNSVYEQKYMKYKIKYLELKKKNDLYGGNPEVLTMDCPYYGYSYWGKEGNDIYFYSILIDDETYTIIVTDYYKLHLCTEEQLQKGKTITVNGIKITSSADGALLTVEFPNKFTTKTFHINSATPAHQKNIVYGANKEHIELNWIGIEGQNVEWNDTPLNGLKFVIGTKESKKCMLTQ